MRYYELVEQYDPELRLLEEGFLQTVTQAVANFANRPIQIVNNATGALIVIKNVIGNADTCETVTYLMRKQIVQFLKTLPEIISTQVWKAVPKGYAIVDFLSMLILLPSLKYIAGKLKGLIGDGIGDTINNLAEKLANVRQIATGLLNAGANSIFGVFQGLGLANELLFDVLNTIHTKIKSTAPQPAQNT